MRGADETNYTAVNGDGNGERTKLEKTREGTAERKNRHDSEGGRV